MPDAESLRVTDDGTDFYGRNYYETHLTEVYHYPKLTDRARFDLLERCLFWLEALLTIKLPPARVLELGCAHGGFVAIMRWAGFDATGLELSPWLVNFARTTFGVPVLQGPVEEQKIAAGSFDGVAAMDVLEHLGDPAATMSLCVKLLSEDGALLIQTPRYREGRTYDEMIASADPFLTHLKPEQHLFLFSETSLRRFFLMIGAPIVEFLPAIFSHYDMFAAVRRTPQRPHTPAEITTALLTTPTGRLCERILEQNSLVKQLTARCAHYEAVDLAKSRTIADLQAIADERLAALQRAGRNLNMTSVEAEKRLRDVEELHVALAARDGRIAELENVAAERLSALERADECLRVVTKEAEKQQGEAHDALANEGMLAFVARRLARIRGGR